MMPHGSVFTGYFSADIFKGESMADNRMKQKERPPSAEGNGLQKSLKLIFVYTVATGSISCRRRLSV